MEREALGKSDNVSVGVPALAGDPLEFAPLTLRHR